MINFEPRMQGNAISYLSKSPQITVSCKHSTEPHHMLCKKQWIKMQLMRLYVKYPVVTKSRGHLKFMYNLKNVNLNTWTNLLLQNPNIWQYHLCPGCGNRKVKCSIKLTHLSRIGEGLTHPPFKFKGIVTILLTEISNKLTTIRKREKETRHTW